MHKDNNTKQFLINIFCSIRGHLFAIAFYQTLLVSIFLTVIPLNPVAAQVVKMQYLNNSFPFGTIRGSANPLSTRSEDKKPRILITDSYADSTNTVSGVALLDGENGQILALRTIDQLINLKNQDILEIAFLGELSDINGDSTRDVLLKLRFFNSETMQTEGQVLVLSGEDLSNINQKDPTEIENGCNDFQSSAPIGDLNKDGLLDIVIQLNCTDSMGSVARSEYILSGKDLSVLKSFCSGSCGGSLRTIDDMNGDGISELLFATEYNSFFLGTLTLFDLVQETVLGSFTNPEYLKLPAITVVPDLNHDNKPDILIASDRFEGMEGLRLVSGANLTPLETVKRPPYFGAIQNAYRLDDYNGDGYPEVGLQTEETFESPLTLIIWDVVNASFYKKVLRRDDASISIADYDGDDRKEVYLMELTPFPQRDSFISVYDLDRDGPKPTAIKNFRMRITRRGNMNVSLTLYTPVKTDQTCKVTLYGALSTRGGKSIRKELYSATWRKQKERLNLQARRLPALKKTAAFLKIGAEILCTPEDRVLPSVDQEKKVNRKFRKIQGKARKLSAPKILEVLARKMEERRGRRKQ